MASTGINAVTGRILQDWAHVAQSIGVILTTRIGTRVMRREFGSELLGLIDRPMTDRIVLAVYAAVATALALWEPRFVLRSCAIVRAGPDGVIGLRLAGDYLPRGHLGDRTAYAIDAFDIPVKLAA